MDAKDYRRKALEFYNKSSNEVQALALQLFNHMDSNGDSSIDVVEFTALVKRIPFMTKYEKYLFKIIDRNGDGSLDFNEFITFFYAIFAACVCDGCRKRFMGQGQLTCGTCFATASNTFDLCSTCYSSKNFAHQHTDFLDFKALVFGSIAAQGDQESSDEDLNDASKMITTPTDPCAHSQCSKDEEDVVLYRKRGKALKVLDGTRKALEVANAIASCQIM